ncbi:Tryptophan aminotransferase-related protein 4 [Glycine soja]|uniref:Tryptophan aminotransferase-related protein 4 n=1 Tax=Glycine soja TaxID=3848 RepID=A0A445GJM5_GLYSO|nr:Tryptophan aminotransferase-related protein 4 [Glycine soja]
MQLAGWHRMSYEYGDGSLISEESKALIRNVYAITEGKYIIFGAGATHLLNAVVHALSSNASSSLEEVVTSFPYYPVKLNITVPYITSKEL